MPGGQTLDFEHEKDILVSLFLLQSLTKFRRKASLQTLCGVETGKTDPITFLISGVRCILFAIKINHCTSNVMQQLSLFLKPSTGTN